MEKNEIFGTLYPVDVSGKTEKKNGLTYLSWAWAWAEVKKKYPTASYEYIKNADGLNYHHDGKTAWVEVAVEIDGLRYVENLPVMDYKNQSIPCEKITSFDVNKAQKRCLVKALAMHGLGLNLYIGEDMPDEDRTAEMEKQAKKSKKSEAATKQPIQEFPENACTICRNAVSDYVYTDPKTGKSVKYKAEAIIKKSTEKYGAPICYSCMMKQAMKEKGGKA